MLTKIKIQSPTPKVLIEVKDTGIGIPQFLRTEKAEKTAEGSGVGLYLSGQIIKLHNGKGSTFYIELIGG